MRKISKKGKNDPTENRKTDPPAAPLEKNKSLIPVFQKGKKITAKQNTKSKPSSSKEEPAILQCRECPAAMTSKPELLKHMKSHLSK